MLPFGFGYYLSYLYRTMNAVIAPQLVAEIGLTASDLGFLTSVYFITFASVQLPLGEAEAERGAAHAGDLVGALHELSTAQEQVRGGGDPGGTGAGRGELPAGEQDEVAGRALELVLPGKRALGQRPGGRQRQQAGAEPQGEQAAAKPPLVPRASRIAALFGRRSTRGTLVTRRREVYE